MTSNIKALIHDIKVQKKVWSSSEGASFSLAPAAAETDSSSKSTAIKSYLMRENGNKYYKNKELEKAIFWYSICVAHALEDSEALCKAYGNRSAVLFELRKYSLCLLDINRALKCRCPSPLRQKLLERKKRCLASMKSSASGSGDADDEINEDAMNPPTEQEPSWRADMLSHFGNLLLPNTSPKIKLKYNEKWGRHFVATADIEPGETLMSENYFVAVLFEFDSRFLYCDFCMDYCDALIPCRSCARVMYCSEQCRTRAYDSYHRMECKLFLLGFGNSLNESFAIRMFLIGTKQGEELEDLMNTLSISDLFAEDFDFSGKPTGSDYPTALKLTRGAFDQTQLKSHMKRAVQIVVRLRKFSFFKSMSADRFADAEVFAIALLLNNHSSDRYINKIRDSTGCDTASKIGKDGLTHGLMVLQYFFNHSCFPNVFNHPQKRENITFAIRPIKKGEQIFIAYDDDFVQSPKKERIKHLNFTCRCKACSKNWPAYHESGIVTNNTSMTDLWCRIAEDMLPPKDGENSVLLEMLDVVAPILDDTTLINLRVAEILRILAKMISLLYKLMKPMSFPVVESRRYLHKFVEFYYNEREGDLVHNKNLKFPKPEAYVCPRLVNNLAAIFFGTTKIPPEMKLLSKAMSVMIDVINRLRIYELEGRFIKRKMID